MVEIVSFLFAIGVGFGFSCWIFGTLLNRSNNIGDSKGAKYEYNTNVNFTSRSDSMTKSESSSYIHYHAVKFDDSGEPKGTDLVRKLTDEERKAYKQKAAQTPPKGLYVSEKSQINTSIVDTEAEFEEWEKRQASEAPMAGVFKPLSPDGLENQRDIRD
jgi:hypothetical protein